MPGASARARLSMQPLASTTDAACSSSPGPMTNPVRRALGKSELLSFNVVRRDRWIAEQAARLPPGTRVLDVGAGSCPYRHLFAHCKYAAQDLAPLHHDQLRFGAYGSIDYRCDA